MANREDVQRFLSNFFQKWKVFDIVFRDERQKNSKALLSLEISPIKRKEIIESLEVEDYSEGPINDMLYGIASMWIFGKIVNRTEVYIKISLGATNTSVICISFHTAEHSMNFPFKNMKS